MIRRRAARRVGLAAFACFLGMIPLANWMIGHVGTLCAPGGPCVVPVAPGLMAPSGVLTVGAALVLRDVVQRCLGLRWGVVAIVGGAALSALVAPASLVLASAAAFLLSEFADFAIYTPLQRERLMLALLASSVVGLVIELDRVPLACVRQPRVPARAGGRKTVGGRDRGTAGAAAAARGTDAGVMTLEGEGRSSAITA